MTREILEASRMYLEGDSDFDAFETYVITFAPDATGERRELLDQFAVKIFYVWDGVSDEANFRRRMEALAGMWTMPVTEKPFREGHARGLRGRI